MKQGYHIVIPARMASVRLPGKPLLPIDGKTLLEHVHRRAMKSSAESVVIATDSEKILSAARAFGAEAVMTSSTHESGSDRIAECIDIMGWPDDVLLVNLQGDEPLMPEACLDQVAALLQKAPQADMASLYWPIEAASEVADSNVVKVVTDQAGRALYFSRSVIPHPRNSSIEEALDKGASWLRHIGLYAYRVSALRAFTAMPASPLERLERLEQLRFLEAGKVILMEQSCCPIPAGVDTAEDLDRIRQLISGTSNR